MGLEMVYVVKPVWRLSSDSNVPPAAPPVAVGISVKSSPKGQNSISGNILSKFTFS